MAFNTPLTSKPLVLAILLFCIEANTFGSSPAWSAENQSSGYLLKKAKIFNIRPQPLAMALLEFSQAAQIKIFYDAKITRGITSPGLSGQYTSGEALSRLLGKTGINYSLTPSGSIKLQPTNSDNVQAEGAYLLPVVQVTAVNPSNANTETTLPKVTVEADAEYDPEYYADPYNKDYVIPNAMAGTKTNTPIMETPLNVQVISKQVLKDQQVIKLDQALRNFSGLTTNKDLFGTNGLFLRGFESPILFRNGFRMDGMGWDDGRQFANVENIEVLKGSAATLYGRVEPGGIVNVVTKQPLSKPYYALNQQFGSYDLYRTSIDATGPLTEDDTLLYRMNASFQSNNTFRDLNSGENVFLAPVMKWNISPKTQVTLEMEYQHDLANMDVPMLPLTNNHVLDILPHNINLGERNPKETENIFVGMNWSYRFNDDWSIKHQINYRKNDVNLGYTLVPIDIDLVKGRVDRVDFWGNFADETTATILDLTGHFKTWGLEHTMLLGGDYYLFESTDGATGTRTEPLPLFPISLDNPVHPGTPTPPIPPLQNPSTTSVDNYGLYLQDQIKLPYHVEVLGGLRYQYVHSTTGAGFGADGGARTDVLGTDDAVTPRVGVSWQPEKWFSLYGNYTENFGAQAFLREFKQGSPTGVPLQPTTAQQWEVGAKAEFLDGRLRATFAYYDLTKQNIATSDLAHKLECNGQCYVAVGEVNSHGPELDIQGEILPGWNIIATYANLDVHITESKDTKETAVDNNSFLKGQRLQYVPRNTGSLWTTYEVQQGTWKGIKFGGGVNFQDSAVDNTNTIKSPGYALVGLMAGYSIDIGKAKITTQLNVDN
jgi:iron complex outermembrane recepter protein